LVLGDYSAYILIRYLQLVVATFAIYVVARHYADEAVAWLITIFFGSHVWLLRSLLWDYVDGSVVVYGLVGIALLLPRENEVKFHVGAGIAFSLVANGNPMGLVVPAAYVATWFIERTGQSQISKCKSILSCLTGVAFGYTILIVAMLIIDPRAGWSFERLTLGAISWLLAGGAGSWFLSLTDIFLREGVYLSLILPFSVVVALVAVKFSDRGESRRKALGALAFAANTAAIFLVFHFVLGTGVLRYIFTLVYALPASIVAFSALIGRWKPASARPVIVTGVVFLIVQFSFWAVSGRLPSEESPHQLKMILLMSVLAVGGLAALAVMAKSTRRYTRFALLTLAVFFASNVFFLRADTARVFGDSSSRETEWDVRDGALYLQRFIAKRVPRNEPIRFWYGTRDEYLNAVQATHLWLSSRLSWPVDAQMPAIDSAVMNRLKTEAHYVAILGNDGEAASALEALRTSGVSVDVVSRGEFRGKAWPGYIVVLAKVR